MRRAARTDGNHGEIREAFRKLGYKVADTSRLGDGFPDLCISSNMITALIEVKDSAKPKSARKLTDDEREFMEGWAGLYFVVESMEDVVKTHVAMTNEWKLRLGGLTPVDVYTRGYA